MSGRTPILALALLALLAAPAEAQGKRGGQGRGEEGGVIPLSRAAEACRGTYRGRLIDARLEGQREYVLLCETREGRILRIRVDARTGRILQTEGRS